VGPADAESADNGFRADYERKTPSMEERQMDLRLAANVWERVWTVPSSDVPMDSTVAYL